MNPWTINKKDGRMPLLKKRSIKMPTVVYNPERMIRRGIWNKYDFFVFFRFLKYINSLKYVTSNDPRVQKTILLRMVWRKDIQKNKRYADVTIILSED